MGINSAFVASKVAHVAMIAQHLPEARRHLRLMFPDVSDAEILGAVDIAPADKALFDLKETYGIEIAVDGAIARGKELRLDMHT